MFFAADIAIRTAIAVKRRSFDRWLIIDTLIVALAALPYAALPVVRVARVAHLGRHIEHLRPRVRLARLVHATRCPGSGPIGPIRAHVGSTLRAMGISVTRIIATATAALAVAVPAITSGPVALADTVDDQYIAAARALGVTSPPDQLINAGHTVCDAWGNFGFGLTAQGTLLGAGVPFTLIQPMEIAAGRAYCPDKLHAIGLT